MLSDTILVNGRSLESFQFYPARADGLLSGQNVTWTEVNLPQVAGPAVVSPAGVLAPRVIKIEGRFDVATPGELWPAIQALLAHLFFGPLEVSTTYDLDKVYYARVEDQPIVAYEPQMLATDASMSLSLRCNDPLVYERSARVIGFDATPTPVPIGTGWIAGVFRVTNSVNPIIRLRRGNGVLSQEVALSPLTVTGSEFATIDSPGLKIAKQSAGVESNALGALVATSDYPFVISPADGDANNPPTLELVGGGAAEFIYRRTFL